MKFQLFSYPLIYLLLSIFSCSCCCTLTYAFGYYSRLITTRTTTQQTQQQQQQQPTTTKTTPTCCLYQSNNENDYDMTTSTSTSTTTTTTMENDDDDDNDDTDDNNNVDTEKLINAAQKFKILTCMSTSCNKKRKNLGMDSLSTFGTFYSKIHDNSDDQVVVPTSQIQIEEGPCLGSCKNAPCVAIEHNDFIGPVALDGMTTNEFNDRVFHSVITEQDADRVWSSVENAIQIMANEDEEEEG